MKKIVVLVVAGLMASCASTPNGMGRVTAPLNDPSQLVRPVCKDPARHVAVCMKGPGPATERHCACMSVGEVARAGLLPLQPGGPNSLE